MTDQITDFILPGGLRCVHLLMPRSAVGYFGVAVRAGSRDENLTQGEAGLAHFVEHTIFKGTRRRSSWHIINRMEAVGGELNAFTTKEDTVVYTAFPRGNLSRAVELVADLTLNSRFPEVEINREREVVADEIDSYRDQPSEAVWDDFEDMIFAGTPLGHNILGTTEALAGFTSGMCRSWLDRYYCSSRMVAFYAGSTSAEVFRRDMERHFAGVPATGLPVVAEVSGTGPSVEAKREYRVYDSHQANTVIGTALPRMDLQERTVLALLSNILGGPGMNSLLNVALREKRGLVYTVESSVSMFTDCGQFNVYYGCDPGDNDRCAAIVRQTIGDIAGGSVTSRRLVAAKKQYLGQLVLSNENRENRIIAMARAVLMRGKALTASEIREMVERVAPSDLSSMASRLLDLSQLTLGPAGGT